MKSDFQSVKEAVYVEGTQSSIVRFCNVPSIITPKNILDAVANDPDDNRILECAAEGKANLIVSGDHHLLKLKTYQKIAIMRPTDFLRTLGVLLTPNLCQDLLSRKGLVSFRHYETNNIRSYTRI